MNSFDILLVLAHFRSAAPYLSVIRHLSPKVRIGVLTASVDASYTMQTTAAQKVFLDLCQQFGAKIIPQGAEASATLMVVQNYPYPPESAAEILRTIRARRSIGLMGLATAGLEKHDSFLRLFSIREVYAPSERFMRFLLAERSGGAERFAGVQVKEVGLPFMRYPIFPEFTADYIIAAPTVFSFHSERGKHDFLETVRRLLAQIPSSARVVYKTHNGSARDYFAPKMKYTIARALRPIPGAQSALKALARGMPRPVRHQLEGVQTGILHTQVLDRAVPMTQVTPYADMSMEAFLPGTRAGVIGGLSNTIWGTLYSGLPFFNCINPNLRVGSSELLPHRSSDALLDTNLRYFGVPYCEGDLTKGARGENIVTDADREADLLKTLLSDLSVS